MTSEHSCGVLAVFEQIGLGDHFSFPESARLAFLPDRAMPFHVDGRKFGDVAWRPFEIQDDLGMFVDQRGDQVAGGVRRAAPYDGGWRRKRRGTPAGT